MSARASKENKRSGWRELDLLVVAQGGKLGHDACLPSFMSKTSTK